MEDMVEHLELELEPKELTFGTTVTFEEGSPEELFMIEPMDDENIHIIDFSAGVEMEGETEFDVDGFQVMSWDIEEIPGLTFEPPAPRTFAFDLLRILERELANDNRPEAPASLSNDRENINDPRLGTDSGDWGI